MIKIARVRRLHIMSQDIKTNFQPLYRIAQYSVLLMLILIPIQIIVFVVSPPPQTVIGFFTLYQENPFLGLLSLDFLYLISNMINVILYVSLFVLLYKERPVSVILALTFGLIGLACYYPSNPSFEMLTLSNLYALDPQSSYLAAGEALMAGYTGTTFNTYYVLSTICLIIFSYTLIKSPSFKKKIGVWGLISGVFMIVPSSAGLLGMIFSLLSLLPWMVFISLLGIEFKKLSS